MIYSLILFLQKAVNRVTVPGCSFGLFSVQKYYFRPILSILSPNWSILDPLWCRNIISVIKKLAKRFFQKWTEMTRKLVKSLFWHHFLELKIFWPKIVFCQKWSEMAKNWSNHFLSRIKVQSRGPFWNNLFLFFLLFNLRWAQLYVSLVTLLKA